MNFEIYAMKHIEMLFLLWGGDRRNQSWMRACNLPCGRRPFCDHYRADILTVLVDQVVYSVGMRPRQELAESFLIPGCEVRMAGEFSLPNSDIVRK